MCILQGKGLGMQVSDNLSPSHTSALAPNPDSQLSQLHSKLLDTSFHPSIYTLVTVEHVQAQYMIPSLLSLSLLPLAPLPTLCSTILTHVYSYKYHNLPICIQ